MALYSRHWPQVALSGLGQIAFCERPHCGAVILAAIALISPGAAIGALAGAFLGTAVAYSFHTWNIAEKQAGLPGPNLAIVGIICGALPEQPGGGLTFLLLAFATCLAIETGVRRMVAGTTLPVLSLPAVLTGWLVLPVLAWEGGSPIHAVGDLPFGNTGMVAAMVLVGGVLFLKSPVAALQAVVLAAAAALISGYLLGSGGIGPVGLWGFTVAPASFAMHAVFLAGSAAGAVAGLAAAVLGAAIWVLWTIGPGAALPHLLLPFVLAVWLVIPVVRWRYGALYLDPGVWLAAGLIRDARARGGSIVAITGAGVGIASGIPDYVSGAWLEPDVPVSSYGWDRYLASPRCRRLYWDACDRFRAVAGEARPNPGHDALADMERAGWLAGTITQNVDRLHQAAGSARVVELHGRIDRIRCLGCGKATAWPVDRPWRRYDMRCESCGEHLKPAVIAFGEDIQPLAWQNAMKAVSGCSVLLVAGTRLAVTTAATLVDAARQSGARVVIVNTDPEAAPAGSDDLVLPYRAEELLPALAGILDCQRNPGPAGPGVVARLRPRLNPRAERVQSRQP